MALSNSPNSGVQPGALEAPLPVAEIDVDLEGVANILRQRAVELGLTGVTNNNGVVGFEGAGFDGALRAQGAELNGVLQYDSPAGLEAVKTLQQQLSDVLTITVRGEDSEDGKSGVAFQVKPLAGVDEEVH